MFFNRMYIAICALFMSILLVVSGCGNASSDSSSDTESSTPEQTIESSSSEGATDDSEESSDTDVTTGSESTDSESGQGDNGAQPPDMPGEGPGGPGGDGQQPPDMPGGGSGGPGGPGGGSSEGDMANANSSVNTTGAIDISNGNVTYNSDSSGLAESVSVSGDSTTVSGLDITNGDYGFTAISASGSSVNVNNSNITLNVDAAISGTETAGTGIYTDSGTVIVSDSQITVNGAGRYSVAAENNANLAVINSVITAGGNNGANGNTSAVSDPASNAGLLISGTSRANFSVGSSHTFYYNSLVVTDGWAALSTDSATGSGLEFVAYNTEALALNGGYGIYADTNCRDYLFGSTLVSAEVGGIISNNGSITMDEASAAAAAVTADGNSVFSYYSPAASGKTDRSIIRAGRNDFQLHSPDMMGEGTSDYSASLSLSHTNLITDNKINGSGYSYKSETDKTKYLIHAGTDYTELYGEATGAYIDYVSGAAILVKSTSADITLNDVTVRSYSDVAVLSALNSDSMSRYLKQDVGNGVNIYVTDSDISGSFVHDDYQRDMIITFDSSTLSGAITYSTADEWNAAWKAYANDDSCVWYGLDSSTYITNLHGTSLTLTSGSVWNVTGESRLTSLTVSADSKVNGKITCDSQTTLSDGSICYTNAVVKSK